MANFFIHSVYKQNRTYSSFCRLNFLSKLLALDNQIAKLRFGMPIYRRSTRHDAVRLQYLYPTQYDVGVDNNGFAPISFEQVKRIIDKQIEQTKDK